MEGGGKGRERELPPPGLGPLARSAPGRAPARRPGDGERGKEVGGEEAPAGPDRQPGTHPPAQGGRILTANFHAAEGRGLLHGLAALREGGGPGPPGHGLPLLLCPDHLSLPAFTLRLAPAARRALPLPRSFSWRRRAGRAT